jgi:hypothetical protein
MCTSSVQPCDRVKQSDSMSIMILQLFFSGVDDNVGDFGNLHLVVRHI